MKKHPAPRRGRAVLGSALAVALIGATVGVGVPSVAATAAVDQEGQIARHLTEATKNSGGDLDLINTIRTYSCDAVEDPDFYDRTSAERKSTRVPLTQIFDNIWFIGSMYVGQFVIQTESGGFVLVDSLNNAAEVDQYTVPALAALGVGEEHPLEAVLLSHGHGDHDGGAARLRALYGQDLDIYIGSGDAGGKSYAPLTIDSGIAQPQELVIGGSTFVAQSIPGHTPGALNLLIPAQQGGQDHLMLMGGRQGHPRGAEAARGYLTGTERTYALVEQYGVDGTILTHPTSDGSTVKMQAIERTGVRDPNPFVIGTDRTLRAAAVWRGCAAAWLSSVDAAATAPVWRVSSLETVAPEADTSTVTARLDIGWGDPGDDADWAPPVGESIAFTVEGTDASCEATTDATGTATCTLPRKLLSGQRVIAAFAGSSSNERLTTASTGSAVVVDAPADTTAPTVTVKEGKEFTHKTGASYKKVSFKLYDAGRIDKASVNGQVFDLSDDVWSDLNGITSGSVGGKVGENSLVVFDVAGNETSVTFTLR